MAASTLPQFSLSCSPPLEETVAQTSWRAHFPAQFPAVYCAESRLQLSAKSAMQLHTGRFGIRGQQLPSPAQIAVR